MTRPVLEQLEEQLNDGEEEQDRPPKEPLDLTPPPAQTPVLPPQEEVNEPEEAPLQAAPPVAVPRPDRSRGRPKVLSDEPRSATQIFLTDSERDSAKRIGGQMSTGIRMALEFYLEQHPSRI